MIVERCRVETKADIFYTRSVLDEVFTEKKMYSNTVNTYPDFVILFVKGEIYHVMGGKIVCSFDDKSIIHPHARTATIYSLGEIEIYGFPHERNMFPPPSQPIEESIVAIRASSKSFVCDGLAFMLEPEDDHRITITTPTGSGSHTKLSDFTHLLEFGPLFSDNLMRIFGCKKGYLLPIPASASTITVTVTDACGLEVKPEIVVIPFDTTKELDGCFLSMFSTIHQCPDSSLSVEGRGGLALIPLLDGKKIPINDPEPFVEIMMGGENALVLLRDIHPLLAGQKRINRHHAYLYIPPRVMMPPMDGSPGICPTVYATVKINPHYIGKNLSVCKTTFYSNKLITVDHVKSVVCISI